MKRRRRGRRALEPAPRRGRAGRRRQARGARARPARPARRRPRADRGLPRPRQDADRALVRAGLTELGFARIQFTPDLMPSDVTGSSIYNQRTADFEFRAGPIFTNLLLADEINRAPPKTQAALLEAMQERQVTIEGRTRQLERPFLVLATQNPIEYEGTYPLPEAQLDRFLLRISVGYPSREDELGVLERRRERRADEIELGPVVDGRTLASDAAGARGRPRLARASATTSSTSSGRRGTARASRSAPAPAGRSRSSSSPARRRRSPAATSSPRTT